jgi:hypothetical protein
MAGVAAVVAPGEEPGMTGAPVPMGAGPAPRKKMYQIVGMPTMSAATMSVRRMVRIQGSPSSERGCRGAAGLGVGSKLWVTADLLSDGVACRPWSAKIVRPA